jgi:hypothetical protein
MASNVGGRLPGLDAHPNSRAMLESLTGDDLTVGFGDFLNVRSNRPEGAFGGAAGSLMMPWKVALDFEEMEGIIFGMTSMCNGSKCRSLVLMI